MQHREEDFSLMHAFAPGRGRTAIEPAPTSSLVESEKDILKDLTDKQLALLFGNLDQYTASAIQSRHPEIAERVHLYSLRKIAAAAKQADKEL